MSTGSGVGEQFALLQLYVQIDDIHDALSASSRHNDSERAAEVLARNEKKLKSWQSTWLSNPSNLTVRAERQWGRDGWLQLQKILANIANTIELIKDADQGAEVEPDNVKFGRKLIRNPLISRHRKKPRVPLSQSPSVLDLALEIGHTIERLGIHSELLFDSLHGIRADKHVSPTRGQQLSRSISVRQGAVALYQACQRSTTKCELDLDLLRDHSMDSDPRNAPHSASDTNPFYHIVVETANDSNVSVWNHTAEGLDDSEAAMIRPKIEIHEKPDLAVFESKPLLGSHIVCIQPSYSEESCYFRVAGAQTNPGSRSESELSALGLKTNKASTEARPLRSLTLAAKIDLAYDLVQCGFYLVGTPWLASLSSKHLRGFGTKDRRVCVLGIETMPLEYIWFLSAFPNWRDIDRDYTR